MGESPKIAEPLELQGRNHVQAKESLNLGKSKIKIDNGSDSFCNPLILKDLLISTGYIF